ncbi:MAG: hypothetical protein ACRENV_08870, partial [Candidatus Dormibacteria bacterium]
MAALAAALCVGGCASGLGVPSVGRSHAGQPTALPSILSDSISMHVSGAENGSLVARGSQVACEGAIATLAATTQLGPLLATVIVSGLGRGQRVVFPS